MNVSDGVARVECSHKGDFNGDCQINFDDFMDFAAAYGRECGDANYHELADFDNDCDVDFFDFMDFAAVYKTIVC